VTRAVIRDDVKDPEQEEQRGDCENAQLRLPGKKHLPSYSWTASSVIL
jgi:hypothetical protein